MGSQINNEHMIEVISKENAFEPTINPTFLGIPTGPTLQETCRHVLRAPLAKSAYLVGHVFAVSDVVIFVVTPRRHHTAPEVRPSFVNMIPRKSNLTLQ